MGRPAIGMAVKNQLMEGLHGHVAGIVIIADDLAEDLRADPLKVLFVECRVLKHVGQEREAEVRVLLENAGGGGGEILCCVGFERATHKIDLFGDLPRGPGNGTLIQQTGSEIRQAGFIRWVLSRPHFYERMNFHCRNKMLFQEQDRDAVCRDRTGGDDICTQRGCGGNAKVYARLLPAGGRLWKSRL